MADDNLRDVLNATHAAVSRQLERERHRPVGEPMSEAEARKLTDQIKRDAEVLWDNLVAAYHGRADIALGYACWDLYCQNEFGQLRLRLPREERQAVVASLKASGLSDRAIESATGVSRRTLIRDRQSGGDNVTTSEPVDENALAERLIAAEPVRVRLAGQSITVEPARQLTLVTGLDRKRYASKREPKPPPGRLSGSPNRHHPPTLRRSAGSWTNSTGWSM
jgi:hypothetical protein